MKAIVPAILVVSVAIVGRTAANRQDIFYNNAARFLRLSDEDIARHRSY